ncbi:MAG: DNA-directed RNA polymerase [Prevotella salivae]|nr:DNA-directed RNA polymerase [Segatella salivae]
MLNIINRAIIQLPQRCKRCTFDSPGLPNDSVGYPGLVYGLWGTTP